MTFPESSAGGRDGTFRPDIEGLRGVAILCVVLYHIGWSVFSGGYIGVDMFFVLSGYLITGLLVRETERSGRIDFVRFFARRMRRLVPAATLVLLAVLLAAWLVYSPIERFGFGGSGLATALYLSNVRFALGGTQYLRAGGNKLDPLLHTWSLGVEEQFYLLWPFLVVLVLLWLGKNLDSGRRRLLVIMLVLVASSLALSIWLTHASQPWAFFGLPTRVWQFAAGGSAFVVQRKISPFWGWLSLGGIVFASTWFSDATSYPGVAAIVPTLATIGLLLSGVDGPSRGVSRLLAAPILRWIGRVSYSWYLWHWPAIIIGSALLPHGALGFRIACALVALVLATATYKWVENPVRQSRTLSAKPLLAIAMGGALIACGAVASTVSRRAAQAELKKPPQSAFAEARLDLPAIDSLGCMILPGSIKQPACAFGVLDAPSTIVLFGDSHAGQWFPAVEEAAKRRGQRLIVRVMSGCPAPSVTLYNVILRRTYRECSTWRSATIREIISLHPSLIFISSSERFVARPSASGRAGRGLTVEKWREGMRATLQQFDDAHIPVTVIRDAPAPWFDVPVCLSRSASSRMWNRSSCTYPLDSIPAATQAEEDAARGLAAVRFLDLTDALCPGSICKPEIAGLVVYRDSNHLTASFSRSLAPYFEGNLDSRSGESK